MLGFDRTSISASEQQTDPRVKGMQEAVALAKKDRPFVVYEATGNDLVYAIFACASNDEGVHMEKALAIAGALSGFACAISAGLAEEVSGSQASAASLEHRLEHLLFSGSASIFRAVETKAESLGGSTGYNPIEAFERGKDVAGELSRFNPIMPDGLNLDEVPLNLVLKHWQEMMPLMNRYDEHFKGWPISWAAACAQLLEMGSEVLPAPQAVQIIMEYAVPMALIGPTKTDQKAETVAA